MSFFHHLAAREFKTINFFTHIDDLIFSCFDVFTKPIHIIIAFIISVNHMSVLMGRTVSRLLPHGIPYNRSNCRSSPRSLRCTVLCEVYGSDVAGSKKLLPQ